MWLSDSSRSRLGKSQDSARAAAESALERLAPFVAEPCASRTLDEELAVLGLRQVRGGELLLERLRQYTLADRNDVPVELKRKIFFDNPQRFYGLKVDPANIGAAH
mgnify:CR=1 FL=1